MKKSKPKLIVILVALLLNINLFAQNNRYYSSVDKSTHYTIAKTGALLYNQMNDVSTSGLASENFIQDYDSAYNCIGADDFTVPEGETWNIRFIDIPGFYAGASVAEPSVDSVNVYIFENKMDNLPGEILYAFENITTFNEILTNPETNSNLFEVILPSTVSLTEGTYWIGFAPNVDYAVHGDWKWFLEQANPTIENEYHWKNPNDGFGTGFTNWTPGSSIWYFPPYDFAYRLYEEAVDNDLAILEIVDPRSDTAVTNETVTVKIKNEGNLSQSNIEVTYQVDGGAIVSEIISGITLGLNETYEYSFAAPFDMSVPGAYEIVASVVLASDENLNNNTLSKVVYNLGDIYTMDSIHQNITTCSGTFVDNGGLLGKTDKNEYGTMTIYPATPGTKARLTFLQFEVNYSDFMIYDGVDMNAPLLGAWDKGTGSPGVVTAFDTANTDGALTVFFEGAGWGDSINGWAAYISCYEVPEDDFAITEFYRDGSISAIYENIPIALYAVVQNLGALEQSKEVTFTANGVVLGSVTSDIIPATGTDTVEFMWTPSGTGNVNLVASIPEDMGEFENNSMDLDVVVYAEGSFFESFEGTQWPPEFWSCLTWQQVNSGGFDGEKLAQIYAPYNYPDGDTLITPQLHIEAGDQLTFAARNSLWWPGSLSVYYKDAETGQWYLLQDVQMDPMLWEVTTIDLTPAAGNNFIGFHGYFDQPSGWGGQTNLDFVLGNGVEIYYPDYDVFAKNLTGAKVFNQNDTVNFEVAVKNTGALDLDSAAYNVVLMSEYGELASLAGQAIAHLETQTYNFELAFENTQHTTIYAVIDFEDDLRPENDTTNVYEIYVKPEGTVYANVGNGTNTSSQHPMQTNGKYSISESIYYESEINGQGIINGVSLYFENTGMRDIEDYPLQLWLTQDPDSTVAGAWTQASNMTLVFDGTINLPRGGYEVHIPFQNSFIYTTANLNMLINSGNGEYNGVASFYYTQSSNIRLKYASSNSPMDPNNVTQYSYEQNLFPNTKFSYIPGQFASLSGVVYNEFNTPMEDALIEVEGTSLKQETAFNGVYDFEYIPSGTSTIKIAKFGYNDLEHSIEIDAGVDTTMDFYMTLKPSISLSGFVVGSDDPITGLYNVDITLEGYNNYNISSAYYGDFTIENVYGGGETYILTMSHPNYEIYVDTIEVIDENIDLGTITLNEIFKVAYDFEVEDKPTYASLTWNHPQTGESNVWALEDGYIDNGYSGEDTETVWLGNLFPVEAPITITSFDLHWHSYDIGTPVPLTLELFDVEGNSMWESEEFMSGSNFEWVTVEIPAMTFTEEFYAMVKWDNEGVQSTFFLVDMYDGENLGYYHYEGGSFDLMSDLLTYSTTFHMRANTIEKSKSAGDKDKVVTGYNVYRGELSDMNNSSTWSTLNTSPVVEHTFIDNTWPPAEVGTYVYAIEAVFTNGSSDFSYCNNISLTIDEPTNVILDASFAHIGNAILAWDTPQNQYVESYNLYLDDMTASFDNITDLYYNYSELVGGDHEVGVSAVYPFGESEIITDNILITVSVDEIDGENITMYPNPALHNVIIANANGCKVEIYNVLGTLVKQVRVGSDAEKVDVSDIESGMYFVKIYNNEGAVIKNASIIKK